MTEMAEGQRKRSNAGQPGSLSWQLTASDVMSLAINVVQNGWDYRELRPDLAYMMGGSATKPRGRGQSGDRPASDAIRMILEEVYQEILRADAQHWAPTVRFLPLIVSRFLSSLGTPATNVAEWRHVVRTEAGGQLTRCTTI